MINTIFRSLTNRNYRLYFTGQFISATGTWLQITALPWFVYKLTNSAFLLGLVSFLSQIFILIFAPFAGTFADHFNRKKLLVLTQALLMLQASILGILVLTNTIQLWHIICLSIFAGLIHSFDMPARQAFVAQIVGKENIINAIALNSLTFNGSRLIGPAIAGILISYFGEGMCFLVNGFSFMAVLIALFFIKSASSITSQNGDSIKNKFISGLKYTIKFKKISSLLILLSVMGMTAIFPMTLMPVFVRDIFKLGPEGLGIFMSSIGIGALCGTLYIASRKNTDGIPKIIFISSISFAILIISFSLIKNVYIAVPILILNGFFVMMQLGLTNSFVQMNVSDEFRGRVMGFFITAFMGFAPIGSFFAGFLAEKFSAPISVIIAGNITIIIASLLKSRILSDD